MKQLIFLVLVLMFSNFIHAENWKLSKHIEVTPPEGLDITFQINEAYDPDEKIIMGWTGDELNYMMMADYQPGGHKANEYWKGLLSETKKQSDNNKLAVVHKGEFLNNNDYQITFKILAYLLDGNPTFNVVYLIKNGEHAYYVMAIPVDEEQLQGTWEKTTGIMQTALLTKE